MCARGTSGLTEACHWSFPAGLTGSRCVRSRCCPASCRAARPPDPPLGSAAQPGAQPKRRTRRRDKNAHDTSHSWGGRDLTPHPTPFSRCSTAARRSARSSAPDGPMVGRDLHPPMRSTRPGRRMPGLEDQRGRCASGLGLCDLLAEIVMCAAPAAPPGGAGPEAAVAVGAGILRVAGTLLAVCLDEALDELVDIARLG